MASPTSRSLSHLRKLGGVPWVVEVWNRFAPRPGGGKGIRQDLYNFGDIITMFPDCGGDVLPEIRVTQTTSYSCVSARKKKILAEPRALLWLRSGGTIDIHGWHLKARSRTDKRKVWTVRVVDILVDDFPKETVAEADRHGSEE